MFLHNIIKEETSSKRLKHMKILYDKIITAKLYKKIEKKKEKDKRILFCE